MSRHPAKLAFIVCILLFSSLAHAAVSCGSSVSATHNSTSAGLSTTGTTFLIAGTGLNLYPNYIQDSAANYWNYGPDIGGPAGANPHPLLAYVFNPITSASDTIKNIPSIYQSAELTVAAMAACTGILAYGPLGINGQANAGTAGPFNMGAAGVTVNVGDAVFAVADSNAINSFTVTSAPVCLGVTFTALATVNGTAGNDALALFEGTMTQAGSCNPSVTMSTGTDWASEIAVFPGGAAGSGEAVPAQFGPTASLAVGMPQTALAGGATGNAIEQDSCTPASVTAGTLMMWPTNPNLTSDGDLVWTDTQGNAVKYWNRHSTSITRFGQTIGAGCTLTIAGQATTTVGGNYGTTPIAGTSALLAHPVGGFLDQTTNNFYFADQQNNVVTELRASDGKLFAVAGSGPTTNGTCTSGTFSGDGGAATSAGLDCPQEVFVSPGQFLVETDSADHRIRYVNLTSGTVTAFGVTNICAGCIQTIVGTGSSGCATSGAGTSGAVTQPSGVTVYSGTLYWTDAATSSACPRVLQLSSGGTISPFAGNGTQGAVFGAATSVAELCRPSDIRFDSNGVAYISDAACGFIAMVKNGVMSLLAGNPALYGVTSGVSPGGTTGPSGPGRFAGIMGQTASALASVGPVGAMPDNLGNLWIPDTGFHRILKMNLPCFASCIQ